MFVKGDLVMITKGDLQGLQAQVDTIRDDGKVRGAGGMVDGVGSLWAHFWQRACIGCARLYAFGDVLCTHG